MGGEEARSWAMVGWWLTFSRFWGSGLVHAWALRIDGQRCEYWEEVQF